MNLIEKLKDKTYVRAFGLMTPEEQECFKDTRVRNCEYYYGGGWTADPMMSLRQT